MTNDLQPSWRVACPSKLPNCLQQQPSNGWKPFRRPASSVVTKTLDIETETKTEAAGFKTEAEAVASETEAEAVYFEIEAEAQRSLSIFLAILSFPTTSK